MAAIHFSLCARRALSARPAASPSAAGFAFVRAHSASACATAGDTMRTSSAFISSSKCVPSQRTNTTPFLRTPVTHPRQLGRQFFVLPFPLTITSSPFFIFFLLVQCSMFSFSHAVPHALRIACLSIRLARARRRIWSRLTSARTAAPIQPHAV